MPKLIEVDEDEYNRTRRVYDTLGKIAKHPEGAKLLERAHKAVDPNVPTPILDADNRVNEPLVALQKKFDDFVAKTEKDKTESDAANRQLQFDNKWKAGQQALAGRGYTPEAIKKFEEQMAEAGITDHEIFADAWEKRNPPPPPAVPGGSGSWNFMENAVTEGDPSADFVKKLIETQGKQDYVADKAANMALAEFRQQVGARR